MAISAVVSLKRQDFPAVGRDRILLLAAVAREGSISAGARAVGLTYRAAWDAIDAMSNVFALPLIETRTGGADKGGARLTEHGQRVIAAFHRLEAELVRLSRDFGADLQGAGLSTGDLVSGFFFKTSARNVMRGSITALRAGSLFTTVDIVVSPSATIAAEITDRSVAELGLHVGRDVLALIKAPFVTIAAAEADRSVANRLSGTVRHVEITQDRAEVALDIGAGKTIFALMAAEAAIAARLSEGAPGLACFAADHVILAID